MAINTNGSTAKVIATPEYWQLLQETLLLAIDTCNHIASAVEAHQRHRKYKAEELLDTINGMVREMRKGLEAIEMPF